MTAALIGASNISAVRRGRYPTNRPRRTALGAGDARHPNAERDQIPEALCTHPASAAFCLPWLPVAGASDIVDRIERGYLFLARDSYVAPFPAALSTVHLLRKNLWSAVHVITFARTETTARSFFAAVTRDVWDAPPAKTPHAWRRFLDTSHAPPAVQSLAPDPAFMGHADLDNDGIAAIRRHARDSDAA